MFYNPTVYDRHLTPLSLTHWIEYKFQIPSRTASVICLSSAHEALAGPSYTHTNPHRTGYSSPTRYSLFLISRNNTKICSTCNPIRSPGPIDLWKI